MESERGGAGGELVRRCRVLCGSAAVGVLRVVLGQCGHRSAAGEYMRCGCGAVAVLVRAEVGEPRDPNTCGAVFKSLRSRVCVTAECRLTNPVFTPTHTPFLYIFSETIHMLSMSRFCFNVYRVYSDIQLPSTPFHALPRPYPNTTHEPTRSHPIAIASRPREEKGPAYPAPPLLLLRGSVGPPVVPRTLWSPSVIPSRAPSRDAAAHGRGASRLPLLPLMLLLLPLVMRRRPVL